MRLLSTGLISYSIALCHTVYLPIQSVLKIAGCHTYLKWACQKNATRASCLLCHQVIKVPTTTNVGKPRKLGSTWLRKHLIDYIFVATLIYIYQRAHCAQMTLRLCPAARHDWITQPILHAIKWYVRRRVCLDELQRNSQLVYYIRCAKLTLFKICKTNPKIV